MAPNGTLTGFFLVGLTFSCFSHWAPALCPREPAWWCRWHLHQAGHARLGERFTPPKTNSKSTSKIGPSKRRFLLETIIIRVHDSLPGGNSSLFLGSGWDASTDCFNQPVMWFSKLSTLTCANRHSNDIGQDFLKMCTESIYIYINI